MKCKNVFLASFMFLDYDRAPDATFLAEVCVTEQCYNALKENGYLLSEEELGIWMHAHSCEGTTRAKSYGGYDGFTWEELRNFVNNTLRSSQDIRMGRI